MLNKIGAHVYSPIQIVYPMVTNPWETSTSHIISLQKYRSNLKNRPHSTVSQPEKWREDIYMYLQVDILNAILHLSILISKISGTPKHIFNHLIIITSYLREYIQAFTYMADSIVDVYIYTTLLLISLVYQLYSNMLQHFMPLLMLYVHNLISVHFIT